MKVATITGSRSDRNAIATVYDALVDAGHTVELIYVSRLHDRMGSVWATRRAFEETAVCLLEQEFDLAFLHGDRHEIAGAALAANIARVPIAHLGGGDITVGSQDDCFRHSITKLSHLHFPSNADSAARIIQMGEDPSRVHAVGDPGIDLIHKTPVLGRDETFAAVGLKFVDRALLVSFHPNTLGDTASELAALTEALEGRGEAIVLVGPNADAGSEIIRTAWKLFAERNPLRVVYLQNMPPQLFYSLMRWCDVMVGNSSAGFYEAPCFGIPVVNIGDRQKGRPKHRNIIECIPEVGFIDHMISSGLGSWTSAVTRTFPPNPKYCTNPYGDGHACERIVSVVNGLQMPTTALLTKEFYDLTMLPDFPTMHDGYCRDGALLTST